MYKSNHNGIWQALLLIIVIASCSTQTSEPVSSSVKPDFYRPEIDLAELFHDVQMTHIYEDSKTFADYRPLFTPTEILDKYEQEKSVRGFDLENFVDQNFSAPYSPESKKIEELPELMEDHIPSHWDYLTRQPRDETGISSLISLPNPYVVPGGRFREIYYWDSYFTMEGLAASERWDLIENMLDNFAYLIDTIGFIPNGNRTYFLGRSQPPFFSSMVMLYAHGKGMESALKYLPQLEKEYYFWMEGADQLDEQNTEFQRVVMLEPGIVLNRYWDNFAEPRPESYREDVEMAEELDEQTASQLFRDVRAACESGWDFSSRWFEDGSSFDRIVTTQILPVDLNSLLLHLESTIGLMHEESGNQDVANLYLTRSGQRAQNIIKYFWDDEIGYFQDYNYKKQEFTGILSLAGMYPFYFDIAERGHIDQAKIVLTEKFLFEGGLVTTLNETGQQWDSPNGWAPLQWISIVGLANYEQDDMAFDIAERWVSLNQKVFSDTRKMMEKYNVTDLSLDAGGGEYPTQDGFGWSNGIAYRLIKILKESKVEEAEVE
jgi:alpha,alpha-trehalase